MRRILQYMRRRISSNDGLPRLALLGLLSGLLVAMVIIAFRLLIEYSQAGLLPDNNPENYEALPWMWRLLLPILGGLLIGIIFFALRTQSVQVGVVHVIERLEYFQAQLPLRNLLIQFVTGLLSLVSGHSGGREGPGIHLGAASASLLGQVLRVPHNDLRVLVACGAAASIAASFNTPIAGVIFAMEVIVMEYTIAGFAPIVLAAVGATALSHWVFGNTPVFDVPSLHTVSLGELPVLVVMGLLMGSVAAAFVFVMGWVTKLSSHIALWYRVVLAGIFVGLCAVWMPEIMGIGYDTANAAILGKLGMTALILIVLVKLLATTVGLGLGLPAGLIGPTLVIGAAAGAAIGMVSDGIFTNEAAATGLYAMLGMAAMMGATLQAPLAAIMALMEMTATTQLIFPGMLVVIIAGLTSSHLYGQQGIFRHLLRMRGLDYHDDPLVQSLRRVSVATVMERSVDACASQMSRDAAAILLAREPKWLLVSRPDGAIPLLMPSAELARFMATDDEVEQIDLLEIPAQRYDAYGISVRATLQQALDRMRDKQVDRLFVRPSRVRSGDKLIGVITRQGIESHYFYR